MFSVKRNALTWLVTLLVLFAGFQTVSANGNNEKMIEEVGPRTVLKVGVENFGWRWDPATKYSNNTAQMHYNMHDGLVRLSPYKVPYDVLPGIAESWTEISPTEIEFKIRNNALFWDGTPVTAEDVAWSINRVINKDHSRYGSAYGRVAYAFEKVEVIDDHTVRVHTVREDPLTYVFLAQTPLSILSKDAFDATEDPDEFFRNPVGCGPYKIAEFVDDQYLKLVRFEQYWGEKAPLEELWYYNVPDASARITALINGEVDFVVSIPPDQSVALEGRNGIMSQGVTWDMFHVYVLNATREPLDDPRVRRAMHLAIDRDALNNALWKGEGIVPTAHHYEGRVGYDPDFKVFEYNPELAKTLLAEAGYNGEEIELDFGASYYLYANQAAPAVGHMWKEVGLNVRMQYVEDWESRDIPEEANMLRAWSNPMYFPDMIGGFDPHWAPTGWPIDDGLNPQLIEGGDLYEKYISLYEIARYNKDDSKRLSAYQDLVEMLEKEATPWIILYQPREYFGMDEDIIWEVPANYRPFTLPFRAGEITFK